MIINEAFWLRSIACLAVAVTHAVNTTLGNYEMTSKLHEYVLILIRFMAFFGTPAFVFISELILSHAYPKKVPKDFLKKRGKFLLFPFLFIAVLYAAIISNNMGDFFQNTFKHLFLGGFYGYFILIIFQFYLLHILFQKYLNKWDPKKVLVISLFINILYLAYFNLSAPLTIPQGEYIWLRGYWLPFVGWIFYFVLGFYCGRNFVWFKEKLHQYKRLVYAMPIFSLFLIIFLVRSDLITVVSSKRVDMLIYTVSIIFAIILLSSQYERIPPFILWISKYSFNIYLLHKIFLYYLPAMSFLHPLVYFIFAYVYSISASIATAKILSYFPVSHYFIGKTIYVPEEEDKYRFEPKLT
ncbi:acyltransferase family protein [Evansella tamaricis]|nr:acyltransferase family protein [Evansella tamaricis]